MIHNMLKQIFLLTVLLLVAGGVGMTVDHSSAYPASGVLDLESPNVQTQAVVGEIITWQVISSGGTINAASTDFRLSGTVGQTTVGIGSFAGFKINHGFWQAFESPCDCRPGDANGDGTVNVGDAVYMIAYVFKGGAAPTPYPICSGDANGDCLANVGDAVYIISYVFKGGASPVTCDQWRMNCGSPLRK